jgi:hypothetical protein
MARRLNAKSQGVSIQGLSELNRDLRNLSKEAQGELKQANVRASKVVAEDASSAARALGGVAAHVAPSVIGGGGTTWAGVKIGGSAYPMALGAEFGGQGRPTTQQFKPHLGRTGYFVYPTIRRDNDKITETYVDAIDHLLTKYDLPARTL